jgi:hypothetical protein
MKQKNTMVQAITPQETQLIEQLRQHPEIQARLQSILAIVRNEDGPLKTAGAVEALLIQELRRLGSATMHQWASQAEARVTTELQQQDPTVLSRKKNADVVVCLRIGQGARADLVQPHPELPASLT